MDTLVIAAASTATLDLFGYRVCRKEKNFFCKRINYKNFVKSYSENVVQINQRATTTLNNCRSAQ